MFCNLFTEISILKRWEGMTVKATVVDAASKFKRLIRRSIADPYAISPVVDGRITNVAEVAAAWEKQNKKTSLWKFWSWVLKTIAI